MDGRPTTLRELPLFLKIEEAARATGIAEKTMYEAAKRDQLPVIKPGKRGWRICKYALLRWAMGRMPEFPLTLDSEVPLFPETPRNRLRVV
jgi:excisionase family DNA binding protein